MNHRSNVSAAFTAIAIVVANLSAGRALAQHEMHSMPGMAPAPKSTEAGAPRKSERSSTTTGPHEKHSMGETAPALKDAAAASSTRSKRTDAATTQHDMHAMSDMEPADKSTRERSHTMHGMAAESGASMEHMAIPGVRPLAPPLKWVPPTGDNRARELLSRSMLDEHLRGLPPPVVDDLIHSFILTELLEYRANSDGPDTFRWDLYGWIGGDYNRIWFKSEGSQELEGDQTGEGEFQLLYGRLIAPTWDLQVGARVQGSLGTGSRDSRTYAVIGVQGLAPYLFDVEPTLFISDRGDISARLTVSFDLLLTQKIVLQPRFEINAALQADEKVGVGEGVNDTEVGVRLRYEIWREFAPYIGVSWLRRYGETASFVEAEGEATDVVSFVAGLRMWF